MKFSAVPQSPSLWGALAGALVFFWIYGWSFLTGAHPFISQSGDADALTALGAGMYYARDAWRFPLFVAQNFNQPDGQNILFTGAIPPTAFVAKLLYPLWGRPIHYMGFWYFVSFLAQGAVFARLLNFYGVRSRFVIFCGALLATTIPMYLFVFGYTNFVAQFLILLTLLFALRPIEKGRLRPLYGFAIYMAFFVMMDVYMFAMSFPFFVAAVLDGARTRRLTWLQAGQVLGICAVLLFVSMWMAGYITPGKPMPPTARGFGEVSTNLVSLFYAGGRYSSLQPAWFGGLSGRHHHGFVYLGMGVLGLILVLAGAAFYRRKEGRNDHPLRRLLDRRLFFLLAVFGVLFFSLSNQVYFLDKLVLKYSIPSFLEYVFKQFRSTARFAWPAVYLVILATLVLCTRFFSRRTAAVLVGLATLIQLVDIRPAIAEVRDYIQNYPSRTDPRRVEKELGFGYHGQVWREALPFYRRFQAIPSFQCAPLWAPPAVIEFRVTLFMDTALLGIPTSEAYVARFTRDCPRDRILNTLPELADGVLYQLSDHAINWLHYGLHSNLENCRAFARGHVCAKDFGPFLAAIQRYPEHLREIGYPDPKAAPAFSRSVAPGFFTYPLDKKLPINLGNFRDFFGSWSNITDAGIGLAGKRAAFGAKVDLAAGKPKGIKVELVTTSLRPTGLHLRLSDRGRPLGRWKLAPDRVHNVLTVPLAHDSFDAQGNLLLKFEVEEFPESPLILTGWGDLAPVVSDRMVFTAFEFYR